MNDSKPLKQSGFGPDLGPFDWADPLRLEDQLTEDERMLRDAANVFAQTTLQPKVIDAYRKEVYLAGYRYEKDRLKRVIPETVVGPEKVLAMAQCPAVFVGNGAVTYRRVLVENLGESAHFTQDLHNTIRAATVARIALSRLESDGCDAADITPVYLRKSDAEINLG